MMKTDIGVLFFLFCCLYCMAIAIGYFTNSRVHDLREDVSALQTQVAQP